MEYYPREIENKIEKWMQRKEVVLLRGPRQSGKTTLFLHLKEKLGGTYVSLENEDTLKVFEENPEMFVERFGAKNLFIDEVQYSKKAGKNIKYIYDFFPDVRMFVTGSGSFDIKVLVSKYLVGRSASFELLPLNFGEFLMWKDKSLAKIHTQYKNAILEFIRGGRANIEAVFEREFRAMLEEYLMFGGFPEIVKEKDEGMKTEILKNLYRTYLERDVFYFLNIRHLEKFRGLLRYLALSTGNIFEFSSVMSELGMDYKTIDNYLNILVNSYVIKIVSPFHRNRVTEIRRSKKVYFVDSGLRNAVLGNFSPLEGRTDKGQILENFVLREFEGFEIKYWRTTTKAEVDFVLLEGKRLIPVEVKSLRNIKRSFLGFLNMYKPERALVLTGDRLEHRRIGKTNVLFAPHWMV